MLHPFSSPFIILETNTRYYYEQVTFDYSIRVLLMGGLCQSSCSDNDDIKLTGIDGRPSVLLSNGLVTASFIYSATSLPGSNIRMGKRLISVMRKGNYPAYSTRLPKIWLTDMLVHFNKIGDKTYEVSRGGEPSMDIDYREEVTLDTNGLPVRVTFTGIFPTRGEPRKTDRGGDRKSDIEKLPIITKETDILNNRTCSFECTFACFIR